MSEYEAAAYKSLEKLREKHDQEILELRENMKMLYPIIYTFSKELMEVRSKEKKQFTLKNYDMAE